MKFNNTSIICPNCQHQFYIDDIISVEMKKQLSEQNNTLKKKYETDYNIKRNLLIKQQEDLQKLKEEQNKIIEIEVKKKEVDLSKKIQQQLEQENFDKMSFLENRIEEQKLNNKKIKLQLEKDNIDKISQMESRITAKEIENQKLNIAKKNYDKLKNDYANDIENIRRKTELILKENFTKKEAELKDEIKKQSLKDNAHIVNNLERELEKTREQNFELSKKDVELQRMKMAYGSLKEKQAIELQRALLSQEAELKNKIQVKVQEELGVKLNEKDEQLKQLNRQIDDMKRKAEQGSMQIQGEAQEVVIADFLNEHFRNDNIEDVPKGKKGADVILVVKDNLRNAGKIVIESKVTKAYSKQWIAKLKEDTLRVKGDVSILVTRTLPDDKEMATIIDGIWVCNLFAFKILIYSLRDGLIKYNRALLSQINKGDKMEQLYSYLTSNEFKAQLEGIIGGFKNMDKNIRDQKTFMEKIWKKQEKELEKAITSAIEFYGSVKGIAGENVPNVNIFENQELNNLLL